MITLYDFGNSVCCQKVRVTLCEKGLEWQAIKVDLFRSEQYDPNYLKLNPKGVVPTLVHDGKRNYSPLSAVQRCDWLGHVGSESVADGC